MAQDGATSIMAELYYEDPRAALEWLAAAFGCVTRLLVADDGGQLVYAETGWGDCLVAVVPQQPGQQRSPLSAGGINTQCMRIVLHDDIDAHCSTARAAGALIVQEPTLHFFGDRTYVVTDLEGHYWKFAQRIAGAATPPPAAWTVSD